MKFIEFDTRALDAFGNRLGTLSVQKPAQAIVNETAAKTRTDALDVMLRSINLQREYVEPKVTLRPATNPIEPQAVITGLGGSITNLERYYRTGGSQVSAAVNWPNGGSEPAGPNPRKAGGKLPWKPRIGAAHLGVPINQKQAALKISVLKGAPSEFRHAFLIRPKAGGGTLVASRAKGDHKGKGKVFTKVGPSVYQMFRAALTPDFLKQVEATLSKNVLDAIEQNIRRTV